MDFGASGTGPVVVNDVDFMNDAATTDEIAVMFWARKYNNNDSSAFWANSTTTGRAYQAHVPWGNGHIYFDTAGCCGGGQRIEALVDGTLVPEYIDSTWWNDWHLYTFSKKLDNKQIWLDGTLFLEGTGAAPLPTDIVDLNIGAIGAGSALFHGVIDDFAVFNTQLTVDDINAIVGGTKPTALPPSTGLLALWEFNDGDPVGHFAPFPSVNAPYNLVQIVHVQGAVFWDLTKVSLKVDGVSVVADVSRQDGKVTVSYVPNPIFASLSAHTATLTYPGAGNLLLNMDFPFTVQAYTKDVLLELQRCPGCSDSYR